MSVPTYDQFIEPVLRFLATKPEGALARDVQDAAADILNLNEEQRAETIASGQLVYKNRTGWTDPTTVDISCPRDEARSKASGLTPPR